MNNAADQHPAGLEQAEQVVEWQVSILTSDIEHDLTFETLDAAKSALDGKLAGMPAVLSKVVTTYYLRADQIASYRAYNEAQDAK